MIFTYIYSNLFVFLRVGLQEVANFMSLVATYLEGFAVVIEPQGSVISGVTEPLIQLCCLNASIAIKPVLEKFQSVVITSGEDLLFACIKWNYSYCK